MQVPTAPRNVKMNSPERKMIRSILPEPEEPRSVETQRKVSVARHPKNYIY